MNILLFAGLSEAKLLSKIRPLIGLDRVEQIYLIRNSGLVSDKVTSWSPPRWLPWPYLREFGKLVQGLRLGRSHKIDRVMGIYFIPHGVLAALAGRILGRPVIQIFIGNDVDFAARHRFLARGLLRNAAAIGVRGSRSEKRLRGLAGGRPVYFALPNLFNLPRFNPGESPPPKEFDIISVGHFDRYKRVDIFLRALSLIRRKYPNVRAAFAGKDVGGRRAGMEALRRELRLEDNVRFLGPVEDIFSCLRRSRVFMLTSDAEGVPMAMIEAMSAGLPCVVPDVSDIPDLARDGENAFIVPPLDPEAFAAKAVRLLEDEGLYEKMSRNALQTIRDREKEYAFPHIQGVWDKIIA